MCYETSHFQCYSDPASESAPDLNAPEAGIILYSVDGAIAACNPQAADLLGYPVAELVGQTLLSSFWQPSLTNQTLTNQTLTNQKSLERPSPTAHWLSLEDSEPSVVEHCQPTGEFVWLQIKPRPLFAANCSIPAAVMVILTKARSYQPLRRSLAQPAQARQLRDWVDCHNRLTAKIPEDAASMHLAATTANIGLWFWHLPTQELTWTAKCSEILGLPDRIPTTYDFFNLSPS
jgi:PAS domain S-box-containing protein